MPYEGWLSYAGTELLNEERTYAYARELVPSLWVRKPQRCEADVTTLADVLADKAYATPVIDDAPWVDLDNPATLRFVGAMPLSISGLTDSTRAATVIEHTDNGGSIVGQRRATKEVRVTALLIGVDQAGVEAGWSWLESALNGGCAGDCEGEDLCFLSYVPDLEEAMGDYVTDDVPLDTLYATVSLPDAIPGDEGGGSLEATYPGAGLFPGATTYPGTTITGGDGTPVGTFDSEYTFSPNSANDVVSSQPVRFPLPCDEMLWEWSVTGTPGTVVVVEVLSEKGLATAEQVTLKAGTNVVTVSDRGVGERTARTQLRVLTAGRTVHLVGLTWSYRLPGDPNTCFDQAARHLRRVQTVSGPTIIDKYEANSASLMKVEWTMVAGTPYVYGSTTTIAKTVQGELVKAAAEVGYYEASKTAPLCPAPVVTPLVMDPDCPPVPLPPRAPVVPSSCAPAGSFYRPKVVDIPESMIPTWQDVVPILRLTTGPTALRGVRVRFMPRPIPGQQPVDLDPCSACGSFGIAYVPPFSTFILDGTTERASITQPGNKTTAAGHLLTGLSDDELFWWPAMSCGTGYLALIETQGSSVVDIDLSVAVRQ